MSLSDTPRDLIRAISLSALAARSLWAAAAVLCCDSTPALTVARSGFTDTVAWPVARTAGWMLEGAVASEGDVTRMVDEGRFDAETIAATVTAQSAATATGSRIWRKDEGISEPPLQRQRVPAGRGNDIPPLRSGGGRKGRSG